MLTALAVLALVPGIARLALFVALHLVPSDYNIVEHAVSDYAVGPTRRLGTAMTWCSAAFWAVMAGAVVLLPTRETAAVVYLLILAVVFVALPFLHTDLEGEPATLVGRLNLVAAATWFTLSYSCMGNIVRMLEPLVPGGPDGLPRRRQPGDHGGPRRARRGTRDPTRAQVPLRDQRAHLPGGRQRLLHRRRGRTPVGPMTPHRGPACLALPRPLEMGRPPKARRRRALPDPGHPHAQTNDRQ